MGNEASRRVSEKLGYRPNGIDIVAPRGLPVEERRYTLRREDWHPDDHPATIEGLEGCLDMFGLGDPVTPPTRSSPPAPPR